MLWKKPGTPGSVTVMDGASPEPGPPAPAAPSREPKSWAIFASGLLSAGWPIEVVLVVWVDVCPDVLAEGKGGEAVLESDTEEEDKVDWELAEGSPRQFRKKGQNNNVYCLRFFNFPRTYKDS